MCPIRDPKSVELQLKKLPSEILLFDGIVAKVTSHNQAKWIIAAKFILLPLFQEDDHFLLYPMTV